MRIGQVAHEAGVTVDTVRFYERRGILPSPRRLPSGYRVYERETVDRIVIARRLQQIGFTLDEIVSALAAHDSGTATCASERWRLDQVQERIDAKIRELREVRRQITRLKRRCDRGDCELATVSG